MAATEQSAFSQRLKEINKYREPMLLACWHALAKVIAALSPVGKQSLLDVIKNELSVEAVQVRLLSNIHAMMRRIFFPMNEKFSFKHFEEKILRYTEQNQPIYKMEVHETV